MQFQYIFCYIFIGGGHSYATLKGSRPLIAVGGIFLADYFVKLISCRYISDGDIKVKFSVEAMSVDSLTDLLYSNESTLDIDILEAGEDRR